jgi:hypothetical protein
MQGAITSLILTACETLPSRDSGQLVSSAYLVIRQMQNPVSEYANRLGPFFVWLQAISAVWRLGVKPTGHIKDRSRHK